MMYSILNSIATQDKNPQGENTTSSPTYPYILYLHTRLKIVIFFETSRKNVDQTLLTLIFHLPASVTISGV